MDQNHKTYVRRVCHCRPSQTESSKLKLNEFPHVWSPGDEILDVNGIPIKGLTFQEAIHTFKVTASPWDSFVLFPSSLLPFFPSGFFHLTVSHPPACFVANPEWVVRPHSAHEVAQPQSHPVLHSHTHEQVELPKLQQQRGTPSRRRP